MGGKEFLGALNALRRSLRPDPMAFGEFGKAGHLIPEAVAWQAARQGPRDEALAAKAYDALARETTPEALAFQNLRSAAIPEGLSPLARMAAEAQRAAFAASRMSPKAAQVYREASPVTREAYDALRAGHDVPGSTRERLRQLGEELPHPDAEMLLLPKKAELTPEHGVSALGVHFSPHRLTMTDPRMYGRGIAGEEAQRLTPFVKDRTYFYTPSGDPRDVTPEAGLGAVRHVGSLEGLYPLGADPLGLDAIGAMLHRMPYVGGKDWNKGLVEGPAATTTVEELIKRLGYSGYTSPAMEGAGRSGTALSYRPVRVEVLE